MSLTEKQVERALSIFAIPKRGTIVRELTERLNIEMLPDAKCKPEAGAEVKCACGASASFIIHGKAVCFEHQGAVLAGQA